MILNSKYLLHCSSFLGTEGSQATPNPSALKLPKKPDTYGKLPCNADGSGLTETQVRALEKRSKIGKELRICDTFVEMWKICCNIIRARVESVAIKKLKVTTTGVVISF